MYGKTVSKVILVLLVASVLAGTFRIESVRADETTIYINADGSVTPSTASISTVDNITYMFAGNIVNWSIVVRRNNIVVDGNSRTLQGDGSGTGILLSGMANVTVENVKVTDFEYGIWLMSSSNNTVSGNDASNNVYGIYLESSSSNTLKNNTMVDNTYNFGLVAGADISFFVNYVDTSNIVDGKPVYYLIDKLNVSVPLDAGYLALVNCTNITVQNLNLTSNEQGMLLAYTTFSTITGNNVTNSNNDGIELFQSSSNTVYGNKATSNVYGIYLLFSSSNNVSGNAALNNKDAGVYVDSSMGNSVCGNNVTSNGDGIDLYSSSSNTVSGNYAANNGGDGIYLYSSSGNVVYGNNVTSNGDGIDLYYSPSNTISGNYAANEGDGISLVHSPNNIVSGNNSTNSGDNIYIFIGVSDGTLVSGNDATNNVYAIYLYFSSNNTVYGNNATNNNNAITLIGSSNNTIYQNNFINNTQQVSSDGSPNTWDNGNPSGGNYWSDYTARYPNASEIDSSGLWNTPYVIDANNTDKYPLKSQYSIPEFSAIPILSLFIATIFMAVLICRKRAMKTKRS